MSDELPDWTDEYDWTRSFGYNYPCPGGWVLRMVEEGAMWTHYPDHGDGLEHTDDVLDEYGEEAYNEGVNINAYLHRGDAPESSFNNIVLESVFQIGETTLFARIDTEDDDLFGTIAEALDRFDKGESPEMMLDEVAPETGRLTEEEKEKRKLARREEENQDISSFAGENQ